MTTVLVVEDEPDIRYLLRFMLTEDGFDVLEAEEGEEALALLAEHAEIRLVVLDLRLPGLDGFAVLEQLKATGAMGRLAVLVVSAHADTAVMEWTLEQGTAGFVRKPFKPAELLAAVHGALDRPLPAR